MFTEKDIHAVSYKYVNTCNYYRFKICRDVLTVTAHVRVGHRLIAAVRQSPVVPSVRTLLTR